MTLFHLTESDIQVVSSESFSALAISERGHLQRVLRNKLDVVAPGCLLIAEEYGAGDPSWRPIDLLAVDQGGNLVVIELQRAEDAGPAELQAIRYAAMVSAMTFDEAVAAHRRYLAARGIAEDARERMLSFLQWTEPQVAEFAKDVRIILASAHFPKELTTAVLWLRNRGIDISCVQLRPYHLDGKTLVDVQVVTPLPETAACPAKVRPREEAQKDEAVARQGSEHELYRRQALHWSALFHNSVSVPNG